MTSGLSTDGFPDESHGHQLQEHSQQILDALLRQIASAVNALGNLVFDGERERDIKILIGGKEVDKSEIEDDQVEKLRRAIKDPESLKNGPHQGTVEIRIDGETVFRNEYGNVLVDELNLTQAPAQEIKAPVVGKQPLSPQSLEQSTVSNQAAQANKEVGGLQTEPSNSLQGQPLGEVASLQQVVNQQAQKIEALETKISVIADSLQTIQNRSLSHWLSSTLSNAAQGFKQFVNRWTTSNNAAVENLQQRAQPVLQVLSQNREQKSAQPPIQQQLTSIDNTVQTVKIRFDDSIKDIQAKLANIQSQLNTLAEQSGVQPPVKTTVEKGAEPAIAAAFQQLGIIQNSELIQSQATAQSEAESSTKTLQTKNVEWAVQTILKKHGIIDEQDGSTYCRGNEYTLSSDLNGTRITANDDGRTIFQGSSFTDRATQADKDDLRILVEQTQQKSISNQSQLQPNASPSLNGFNADTVVAAAKKLLEKIPAQTAEGTRSFTTGSGYHFEKAGHTITVSSPARGELIRSEGTGSKRQLSVSDKLTTQDASNLEKIGGKINQDLSTKPDQSQSRAETQKQVQSQTRGRR